MINFENNEVIFQWIVFLVGSPGWAQKHQGHAAQRLTSPPLSDLPFFFFFFNASNVSLPKEMWSPLVQLGTSLGPLRACWALWLGVLKITGEVKKKKNVEADWRALLENETQKPGSGRFYLKTTILSPIPVDLHVKTSFPSWAGAEEEGPICAGTRSCPGRKHSANSRPALPLWIEGGENKVFKPISQFYLLRKAKSARLWKLTSS